jgi:hypothetical protein
MILPIKAGDPRRSLASNKFYQDLNNLYHRLDIISEIPFDVPVIIIQRWLVQDFDAHISTIVVQVSSMDEDYIYCVLYASDKKFIFFINNKVDSIIQLPITGVVQWRLLDNAFLGTTINYPVKTSEYPNLFNMEL